MGPELNVTNFVRFQEKLPSLGDIVACLGFRPEKTLLIVDRALKHKTLKSWLKLFPYVYSVKGGESLKDLSKFPSHVAAVERLLGAVSPQSLAFVAVGGGTVGDFSGFLASVFKRGVPYVQVPTTFLSALDSAHGGKTGLNLKGLKNQVGTFHQPRAVWIAGELLRDLPKAQSHSALGELLKMALLAGGELFQQLSKIENWDFETLWKLAPLAVGAKYQIVLQDPFESSGERQLLNLGHTLGHALEAHYEIPHGEAVSLGLSFAVEWSSHRGLLTASEALQLQQLMDKTLAIPTVDTFFSRRKRLSGKQLARLLSADKKAMSSSHVKFVFLETVGQARRITVPIESLVTEAQRQGWIS